MWAVLTSARASADSGVSSAGLTTTVQPAARAAPAFLVIMALGKFHCGQMPSLMNHSDKTSEDHECTTHTASIRTLLLAAHRRDDGGHAHRLFEDEDLPIF